jgi:hypothetical protein
LYWTISKIHFWDLFTCKGTYMIDWVGRIRICVSHIYVLHIDVTYRCHIYVYHIYICMYPIYTYLPSPSALWFFHVWLIYMCSCMPCHLTHTCVYVCVIYIYVLHMYVAQVCVMRICETNLPHPCQASHDNLSIHMDTVYMHTCMCLHRVHAYMYVCFFIYMYTYTHAYICIYVHI